MDKKHILFATHGFPPRRYGGVENYTYHLAQRLQEQGHLVSVVFPIRDSEVDTPYILKEEYTGIQTYIIVHPYDLLRFSQFMLNERYVPGNVLKLAMHNIRTTTGESNPLVQYVVHTQKSTALTSIISWADRVIH